MISPVVLGPTTHYIDGHGRRRLRTFVDRNPYNDEVVADITAGGPAEAAGSGGEDEDAAFPAWAAMEPEKRVPLP